MGQVTGFCVLLKMVLAAVWRLDTTNSRWQGGASREGTVARTGALISREHFSLLICKMGALAGRRGGLKEVAGVRGREGRALYTQ